MSRSLIFAFLCALIIHSVVALVELSAYKNPIYARVPPKTLTMNIVVPRPVKKIPLIKNPSTALKKPIVKKRITEKIKSKQRAEPKVARKKMVQFERPVIEEKLPEKNETLAGLSPADFPAIKKKEDDFFEEDAFVPDMVDIPQASPNIKDMPHKVKKEDISSSLAALPITYANPIYKRNMSPPYPLLARKRGYQGTVLLEVLVSKDGKAASVQLVRSSGYEILDRAAIKGVRDWLFYPAKGGDELLEMWVKIPIRFTLN
ncbi:MAG: energy transducer TonB [Deltaproteobacteria bacterium]|nr:energy transducer TonB [Deltaproteobacteria bacterium]